MKDEKSGGQAFPINPQYLEDGSTCYFPGMTLRDYFAGQALKGMVSSDLCVTKAGQKGNDNGKNDTEIIAIASYHYAEAMLKERESR